MRETSALYKTLRQDPDSVYEVNIVRGQTVYGMNDIISASVHQSLIGERPGPSVGGTVSARCSITIREASANWPRMASFEVRVRLCSGDGLQVSEWLSLGVFLTDQRREEKYGNLHIEAFDAMLMLDQYWTDRIPGELAHHGGRGRFPAGAGHRHPAGQPGRAGRHRGLHRPGHAAHGAGGMG